MSIRDVITSKQDVELWRFHPPNVRIKRRLYLTATAHKHLTDRNSATNVLGLRGYIQNALVHWVSGGRIRADERGKPRFLKRLCPPPPEIWEVRVTDPVPQVRLIGRVVEKDTLILDRFHTRSYLGGKGDPGWEEAMAGCHAALSKMFPDEPLLMADTIYAYVSENRDDCKLCPAER
jgi:hypothetical protein